MVVRVCPTPIPKVDDEVAASTQWGTAMETRQHLATFLNLGEALFPDDPSGASDFSAKAALETLQKLRSFGFGCNDNWDIIVAIIQIERYINNKQLVEAVSMCSTLEEFKENEASLHNVVKTASSHGSAEARRDDIRQKIFFGWASHFFATTVRADAATTEIQEGKAFLQEWAIKVGEFARRSKFEQHINCILSFDQSSLSQPIVDAWLAALDDLTSDKKSALTKAFCAGASKDKGVDTQTIGNYIRTKINLTIASWNADKGYMMDLASVSMSLKFLSGSNKTMVSSAIIGSTDFANRWSRALDTYNAILKNGSSSFARRNADDLTECRTKLEKLSKQAIDGFRERANKELRLDELSAGFSAFATKVHESGLQRNVAALCKQASTMKFIPASAMHFFLGDELELARNYNEWFERLFKNMAEALPALYEIFASNEARLDSQMKVNYMELLKTMWPQSLDITCFSLVLEIRGRIRTRVLELLGMRCKQIVDFGVGHDLKGKDVFDHKAYDEVDAEALSMDDAPRELAAACVIMEVSEVSIAGNKVCSTDPLLFAFCAKWALYTKRENDNADEEDDADDYEQLRDALWQAPLCFGKSEIISNT